MVLVLSAHYLELFACGLRRQTSPLSMTAGGISMKKHLPWSQGSS